jgi:hypothetical protein
MVERIQAAMELAMIMLFVIAGVLGLAVGITAIWFVCAPFKAIEAEWRAVRHG